MFHRWKRLWPDVGMFISLISQDERVNGEHVEILREEVRDNLCGHRDVEVRVL